MFVQPSGEIILFGITESLGFPAEAVRPKELRDGPALFVMRLDAKARRVLFCRLLANASEMSIQRLASGDFLIAATTTNAEFPTTAGAFGRSYNGGRESWGGDVFLMGLSADLNTVSFATLFGGAGDELFPRIATVGGGDVFVAGRTTSKDLPVTVDALERTLESDVAFFLARFSGDGRQLKYCTYLGAKGGGTSFGTASLIYDGRSSIYFAGNTTSPDFPVTADALQTRHHGGLDVFLLAFDTADNSLAYGSYLGGSKDETFPGPRLAFDRQGSLYVIGTTDSADFPTRATSPRARSDADVFISKFSVRQRPSRSRH